LALIAGNDADLREIVILSEPEPRLALVCGIIIPHTRGARRSLKFMPKRGSDADSRIFFDQLVTLAASRLKAMGAIRLEDRHRIIAFGGQTKAHRRRPYRFQKRRLVVLFRLS
jgi:hypothetical protein